MRTLVMVAALLSGCVSYAGIAVAPNGSIWIVRNVQGFGGSVQREAVFLCVPRGPELVCSRVPVRDVTP